MGFCNASVSLADKEEYEHGSSIELEQVSDTVATGLYKVSVFFLGLKIISHLNKSL